MRLKKLPLVSMAIAFVIGIASGLVLENGNGVRAIFKVIGVGDRDQTVQTREASIPEQHQGKLQLFILAGQSNMSGMGEIPESGVNPNPRIYVFGNDYRWKIAVEPVDDSNNQVDTVSEDLSAGYSPAVSFATTLLEQYPHVVIGLIPCAKGGSSIHEWRRNLDESTLYGSCLKRTRAASVMGSIAGILYFQGEIDTVDPSEDLTKTLSPHQWADKFTVLVNNWRSDLRLPELPIVFAQIGSNTEPERFKNWTVVQDQQRQVRVPFSAMITTHDLALQDYVHFTTESYQTIGQRFANAYINLLTEKNEQDMEPRP